MHFPTTRLQDGGPLAQRRSSGAVTGAGRPRSRHRQRVRLPPPRRARASLSHRFPRQVSQPARPTRPDPGSAASLEITNRYRLLRGGRRFALGSDYDGLHFLALSGNLGRQFEFVQHTWLDNPKFGRLHDDVDPIVSPRTGRSVFSVTDQPIRRRFARLRDFVTTLGGAYLFLPGLRAPAFWPRSPDEVGPRRQRRPHPGLLGDAEARPGHVQPSEARPRLDPARPGSTRFVLTFQIPPIWS